MEHAKIFNVHGGAQKCQKTTTTIRQFTRIAMDICKKMQKKTSARFVHARATKAAKNKMMQPYWRTSNLCDGKSSSRLA